MKRTIEHESIILTVIEFFFTTRSSRFRKAELERVQSNPENRSCKDIVHEAAALVLSAARIRALLKTTCMRELLCVIPKASVLQLAKAMVDWSVSSVAITDEEENNKKVIGILTERHIIKSISKGAFLITEPFLLVPL